MNASSPNRMVWRYFNALRRMVRALDSAADDDELKENVAVCIVLGVSTVETFLNVLFRVVVSEPGFTHRQPQILKDIEKRKSLDYKLKSWPKMVFGQGIDFQAPPAKAFLVLKDRRNRLMHFTSSHQTLAMPGIQIDGLADTSAFDTLSRIDAVMALELAEGMLCIVLRLCGVQEDQLPHALHSWTGKPPNEALCANSNEVALTINA